MVLSLVGQGGMGEVYAAYDPKLDRRIALKLLRLDDIGGAARRESRLVREAQAIARLSHPNVVTVHDVGTIGDRTFVAMEYVDGGTLSAWLAADRRSQREILAVFAKAARGLGAAHAAGLVHRDFKPQNVMIGSDGEVRVTDFGLARRMIPGSFPPDAEGNEGPGTAAIDAALTQTGELVGTPLYMSPEQFQGKPTDAQTDQFSFCVALYQALYGEHPFFSGGGAGQLMAEILAGRVRPAPARNAVPPWLRRTLLRGLSTDPASRWPSMDALTVALARDRTRTHRRWATLAALTAAGIAIAIGLVRVTRSTATLCQAGPSRLADVWEPSGDGARRTAVRRAFLGTGHAFAEETWKRVAAHLDDYSRRWVTHYTDACEATNVRGDQSAGVLDLRMACLEGPRGALRALTAVFARADGTVLLQAARATQALPPLERCANVALLRSAVPPPDDPGTRHRLDEIRTEMAEVKALVDTGQWTEGRRKAAAVIAAARATGYAPALVEPLEALAWIQDFSGEFAASVTTYEEALWVSLSARRDDVALECASCLASNASRLGRREEADRWLRMGQALLDRLGPEHERGAAWFHHNRGNVRNDRGDHTGAVEEYRLALAAKQKVLPPDHHDIAVTWAAIGAALTEGGKHEAALEPTNNSLAIYQRAFGADSPLLAYVFGNRGEILGQLGRHAEAERDLRESLARWTVQIGPDHLWTAHASTALGNTLMAQGRTAEAREVLEKALRIREKSEPITERVAQTRFALARVLWRAGSRVRAVALAQAAHDAYERAPSARKEADEVAAWLGDHRLAGKSAR
jgi:eukaryotic-like serine/threonine-protein kinase